MANACLMRTFNTSQSRFPALLGSVLAVYLSYATLAQADTEGVPLHGFVDVGFSAQSKDSPNPRGFYMGSFDVYLTPQFDNNVKGLIELMFETTAEGVVATDLERLQIGYTVNDSLTLWGGRFHTPYGVWNTAFHHGAQMQTSVLRPRFLDFEDKGGILPAHMVGMLANGKLRAGNGKFTYSVYTGNGPKISMADPAATSGSGNRGTLNINIAGDNNHQAMAGFNLGYEFPGIADGLELAFHGLRGDVDDDPNGTPPFNKTELNITGGSIVYLENDWEVLGEYYRFNNKDKSGTTGSHGSWADYLQIGKSFNALTPFLRLEKTMLDQQDNYFNLQDSGQSYNRQALGLKYDLSQKASLKLELLNSRFTADGTRTAYSYRSMLVQYAIRF